jgi:hypothetical protein
MSHKLIRSELKGGKMSLKMNLDKNMAQKISGR